MIRPDVEALAMKALRAAAEPLREAVLYERVLARGAEIDPEGFVGVMEHLAATGRVRMHAERDSRERDPEPFEPRFWILVR